MALGYRQVRISSFSGHRTLRIVAGVAFGVVCDRDGKHPEGVATSDDATPPWNRRLEFEEAISGVGRRSLQAATARFIGAIPALNILRSSPDGSGWRLASRSKSAQFATKPGVELVEPGSSNPPKVIPKHSLYKVPK
jgi:hypothetical protein